MWNEPGAVIWNTIRSVPNPFFLVIQGAGGDTILELGAGTGQIGSDLAASASFRYIGLDLSQPMLVELQNKLDYNSCDQPSPKQLPHSHQRIYLAHSSFQKNLPNLWMKYSHETMAKCCIREAHKKTFFLILYPTFSSCS